MEYNNEMEYTNKMECTNEMEYANEMTGFSEMNYPNEINYPDEMGYTEEEIISNIDISRYFNKEYGGYDSEPKIYTHQPIHTRQPIYTQQPIPAHLNIYWSLKTLLQHPFYEDYYDKLY